MRLSSHSDENRTNARSGPRRGRPPHEDIYNRLDTQIAARSRAVDVGKSVLLIGEARESRVVKTERLEIRLPRQSDRARFVELFCDDEFMVFSGGVLTRVEANTRFDQMLQRANELPFAKQPVIDRSSGTIIGYSGVDWFDLEGRRRLEFGWRLVPEARGRGYTTEATRAVLATAAGSFVGEILAMIDPTNTASLRVADKVGFAFWKQAVIDGYLDNLYRLQVPAQPSSST